MKGQPCLKAFDVIKLFFLWFPRTKVEGRLCLAVAVRPSDEKSDHPVSIPAVSVGRWSVRSVVDRHGRRSAWRPPVFWNVPWVMVVVGGGWLVVVV